LFLLLTGTTLALAQSNNFTLDWWTVDGGGGTSSDGRFTLQSTIAQPDAGQMSSRTYTLLSGYWDVSGPNEVYLPVVLRP
jgi:hypothetical protein